MNGVLRSRRARATFAPFLAVVFLLAANPKTAEACFFGCIYHFGYFTVSDGDLVYYQGCESYTSGRETYVVCYYSSVLN